MIYLVITTGERAWGLKNNVDCLYIVTTPPPLHNAAGTTGTYINLIWRVMPILLLHGSTFFFNKVLFNCLNASCTNVQLQQHVRVANKVTTKNKNKK